jgi:ribosome-associated protein
MRISRSEEKSVVSLSHRIPSKKIAETALTAVIEQRGLDALGLDLSSYSGFTDYFVIASGTSQRHVQGMCDKVKQALLALGEQPLAVSGYENSEWILLDYGDVVVHLFYEPMRDFYQLEELWRDAERIQLPEELEIQAKRLRTGIVR